ncbi:exopolysaccharide biosynthesis protein [Rhizobium sp. KVB221]|uniref:Exopolysaccharide biosynthesis protein n=1 Tax=Rhizobium setariae TaxID=2801340 RepID=A0A936YMK8_9HYPH|nr:exopolysaccharide biosynthesis protein [Rhizobium setariae]MBL0373183.1 exopolysaccharide biosynthesis protein [Rhizobium setariae]
MEMIVNEMKIKEKPEKLSELLRHVSDNAGEKVTLGEIADAMADRSFGAFLVVFCLPNLIPLPPGATFVLGLPLVFIAFQMAFSRLDTIWLPKRLHYYAFDNKGFSAVLDKFVPWMQKAEKLIKPRFWPANSRFYERIIGLFSLLLALVIFLPIPLGNMGPAYALALMGLGLTERDGLVLAVGAVIGIVFSVVIGYIGYELVKLVPHFLHQIPLYWTTFLQFFS